MNKQRGFTLIEIAIVLVIIGLLLGGVLKGQELITGARVRNLISQQDGVKAAYFGFLDRFRALPGDYLQATTNIANVTQNGNGNGQIESTSTPAEDIAVWHHLSRAGFITGAYNAGAAGSDTAMSNPYGAFLILRYTNVYAETLIAPATAPASRHILTTGNQIPADLLAEIDRKVDDGAPRTGSFRFTPLMATGIAPVETTCTSTSATPIGWLVAGSIDGNCAGAQLF